MSLTRSYSFRTTRPSGGRARSSLGSFGSYGTSSTSTTYRGRSGIITSSTSSSSSRSNLFRSTMWSNYRPRYTEGRHRPAYDRALWSKEQLPALRTDEDDERIPKEDIEAAMQVDLNSSKNRVDHHTDVYECQELIVRRGQTFDVILNTIKKFDKEKDELKLQFVIGDKPQQSKNTLIRLRVGKGKTQTTKEWGAVIDSVNGTDQGSSIKLRVMSSCEAVIGKYDLYVESPHTNAYGKVEIHRYKHKKPVYVLFNPWCKEDQVYLGGEKEKEEYVMNEAGRIFVGKGKSDGTIHAKPWNFGQFDKVVLDAALFLLDTCYLDRQAHNNPTQVCRAMTAMANSNDQDGGVLCGNWDGCYTCGTSPGAWMGSVAILDEYMLTKREVKYGQCWIFSGLLTTLCRCLGIPTRSVTNFESAHDRDFSMTIDFHLDTDGRPLKHMDDSVWNFHVWNESWFKRPDLPEGNDGWQAFDATPQESSEGMFRCGPAPVAAIKEGNVFYGFDAKFVYAEVNGDKVTWMVDANDDMMAVQCQPHSVGLRISTKALGSNEREDITNLYKYPEGSEKERESMKRASNFSSRRDNLAAIYDLHKDDDVEFKFDGNMAKNGEVTFQLSARNKSKVKRTVELHMYAMARYYTGVPGDELTNLDEVVELDPEEAKEAVWPVEPRTYFNRLDEDATIGIYIMAKVRETGQLFADQDTYWIEKPNLDMKVSKETVQLGEEVGVTIKFRNPLAITLTDCRLKLEAPSLRKTQTIDLHRSIHPDQEITETVKVRPKTVGSREIIAIFHSKQLQGIDGAVSVKVIPAPKEKPSAPKEKPSAPKENPPAPTEKPKEETTEKPE